MTAGSTTLIRGDALALPLADASVDLVVTSPPERARALQVERPQVASHGTPDLLDLIPGGAA